VWRRSQVVRSHRDWSRTCELGSGVALLLKCFSTLGAGEASLLRFFEMVAARALRDASERFARRFRARRWRKSRKQSACCRDCGGAPGWSVASYSSAHTDWEVQWPVSDMVCLPRGGVVETAVIPKSTSQRARDRAARACPIAEQAGLGARGPCPADCGAALAKVCQLCLRAKA